MMLNQRLREIAKDLNGASAADDDILFLRSELPPPFKARFVFAHAEGLQACGNASEIGGGG
jgi:hypothetical protein